MSRPVISVALLARPEWRGLPLENPVPEDSRIWPAPLQHLVLEQDLSGQLYAALRDFVAKRSSIVWAVITSPASVIAFADWMSRPDAKWVSAIARFAAVGSGTAEQMMRRGIGTRSTLTVGGDASIADAMTTVEMISDALMREGASWADQSFIVVGGVGNRPTLCDALRAKGAGVMMLPLYRREDLDWPERVWAQLRAHPDQTAVVVTSSTVIERLMASVVTHGVDPVSLTWATHHATIAANLTARGVSAIRRVRLDVSALSSDLFEHEQYW
jgi:uroporphyrinogen-III synthase